MFLSAHEIAHSREHALSNFLSLSATYFNASQRLSELLSTAGREAIEYGGKQLSSLDQSRLASPPDITSTLWIDNATRAARMLEQALEIISEVHKAMIRSAEAQACVFDEMAFAALRRATKTSPWEAELALKAMKTTLEGAEQTLHGMSDAAIQTIDMAEREVQQVTTGIAESKPAPRKRQVKRKLPA